MLTLERLRSKSRVSNAEKRPHLSVVQPHVHHPPWITTIVTLAYAALSIGVCGIQAPATPLRPSFPGPRSCASNADEQQAIIERARNAPLDTRAGRLTAAADLFYRCTFTRRDEESKIQDLDLSEELYEDAADFGHCNQRAFASLAKAKGIIAAIEAVPTATATGVAPKALRARVNGKVSACLLHRRRYEKRVVAG
ncbi:MAG: hypothetical protein ABR508_09660 [Candidatus Baltobacteraceae bacterium]